MLVDTVVVVDLVVGRNDGGIKRVRMYEYAVPKSSDASADEMAMETILRSAVVLSSSDDSPADTRSRPIDNRSSSLV